MDEISERSFLDYGQVINFVQNAINAGQYFMYGSKFDHHLIYMLK